MILDRFFKRYYEDEVEKNIRMHLALTHLLNLQDHKIGPKDYAKVKEITGLSRKQSKNSPTEAKP